MTTAMGVQSTRRLPARLAAGLAIAGVLLLGTFIVSASADERRGDQRGGDRGHDRGHGGRGYAAPPVVYGNPGYYPPPVVYGPAVGISLPGISIGVR
jgi:hypothetical protein